MKETALTQIHIELGAKMAEFAGFNMPVYYKGGNAEHFAVRQQVGVFDVSHMGEFCLKGKHALDFVQKISTNDASKLEYGKAQYSCMTNKDGGIIDDMIIYCIDKTEYILVVNASNIEKDWNWIKSQNTFGVEMTDESDDTSLLAVQGPKALETVQKLTDVKLSEIPFYQYRLGSVAKVDNVVISATGYTGSGGFELYFKNKDAKHLWSAILESGEEFGIEPCGLAARDTLRLEMGYCLYGNDITDHSNPLEAGLGWVTKFSKEFIASDILLDKKAEGLNRKLVAFKLLEKGIPRKGYTLNSTGMDQEIGVVTSGTMSPCLECGIGLGYVKKEHSKIGTQIDVQIRKKKVRAEIVKLPFYKS